MSRIIKNRLTSCSNDFNLGAIDAKFEAEKYDDTPLLDTRVELVITPFSITWNDQEALINALQAVIDKYSI